MPQIKLKIKLTFLLLSLTSVLFAQEKINSTSTQIWGGYINSLRLNDKYSLWNDIHYVPESFIIVRHGISAHLTDQIIVTAGYAWLETAVPALNNQLKRFEHRPWGQLMLNLPVGEKYSIHHRVRYDYRIRQSLELGIPTNSFTPYHRVRFMTSIRRPIKGNKLGNKIPFVNIGNELLVNFGDAIVFNHFDQNRFWVMAGMQLNSVTFQLGYMHRFVQGRAGNEFNTYHTPVLWITHTLYKKKSKDESPPEDLLHREP
jgi:hypothetical protein